jgi:hypothetical protein
MKSATTSGHLLLATISGFTSFLAKSELEHAQDIVRRLIILILKQLTPIFTFAQVGGDAVFVFGLMISYPGVKQLLS